MGRLTFDHIRNLVNSKQHIKDYYRQYDFDVFVETGTHVGSTIFAVAPFFKEAHTIELSSQFYEHCKHVAHTNNITNIKFYNGSSDAVMQQLCAEIDVPTIFFLDSHWSKENTARGEVDVPLLTELGYIKHRNMPDIVIVDDHRLFGTGGSGEVDWTCITEDTINAALQGHIFDVVAADDRYAIFLKPMPA